MGIILSIRTLLRCSSFLRHCLALCLPCSVLELCCAREPGSAPPKSALQRSARKRFKMTPADRLLWVWPSRWSDWRSAVAIVKPETVAVWRWLSPVLDLEGAARPTRTAGDCPRGSRPDPPDVPGKSRLGCTPHPRRAAQTWYRHRREQRRQIHGAVCKPPSQTWKRRVGTMKKSMETRCVR